MFFLLSKTLGELAFPSHFITVVAVAGLLLLCTRFVRAGRVLLKLSLVLVVILGLLPTGRALMLVLEQRFPPWRGTGEPTGIVVLGGAIEPGRSAKRGSVSLNGSAERVTVTAALARRYPNARIVFSGGSAALISDHPPEAAFMLDLWESFGIPRSRIVLEERSRNTRENAVFAKTLVDPKPGERWLLVTSAIHMPRAVGVFRKIGFAVEPYPVDWRSGGWSDLWTELPWPLSGLYYADEAAKEWAGLVAYRLAGYTSKLLPGPEPSPAGAAPADKRP
jgi:uncharacterized SAM-binding protein YcdF (DUF218 family)